MNKLPTLYYISHGASPEDHLIGIEKVCIAGCKIVQLRLKSTSSKIVEKTAEKAQAICKKYNAQLVINDYTDTAEKTVGTGLHLGKNDSSVYAAKKSYPNTLVGGTANTLEDCIKLYNDGADYIGLGPFQFTSTKANLDPVIGVQGYKDILAKLKSLKITTPIYAIGGIKATDIPQLLELGLHGVAVSGLFTNQTENEIKKIIDLYE